MSTSTTLIERLRLAADVQEGTSPMALVDEVNRLTRGARRTRPGRIALVEAALASVRAFAARGDEVGWEGAEIDALAKSWLAEAQIRLDEDNYAAALEMFMESGG